MSTAAPDENLSTLEEGHPVLLIQVQSPGHLISKYKLPDDSLRIEGGKIAVKIHQNRLRI
jgi:hypothetical protein